MKRKKILYFVSVSTLPQPYSLKNTMYRMPKRLYILSTKNRTRARRYTDDPAPPTIFANLNVTINDNDSFFKVCFVLICKDTDVRHFKYSACFTGSEQLLASHDFVTVLTIISARERKIPNACGNTSTY